MPYIDLAGLSRYASRQKDRLERDYALLRDMQWLRTEKAGAVSLWPVGGTPLKPAVDFLFSETSPASGDKGPENPSTISGVSSVKVTRCGKNLCPLVNVAVPNVSTAGVTILVDAVSGSISISGKATANSTISFTPALVTNFLAYGTLRAGKTYTFSLRGNTPSTGFKLRLFVTTTSSPSWSSDKINVTTNNSSIYMLPDDIVMAWLRIDISQDTDFGTGCIFTVQVEEGETATEFEPYFENKYPLPLGNTYYGGTLDVASGVMTVTHICDTFTRCSGSWFYGGFTQTAETLSFQVGGSRAHLVTGGTLVSNMFIPGNSDIGVNKIAIRGSESSNIFKCSMVKSALDLSGVADPDSLTQEEAVTVVNAFLSQNPLKVVYNPITPEIVQLTPTEILSLAQTDKYTPRVNTVYTDAESVQVGYIKSPIREEFELQQAVAAQGGNV